MATRTKRKQEDLIKQWNSKNPNQQLQQDRFGQATTNSKMYSDEYRNDNAETTKKWVTGSSQKKTNTSTNNDTATSTSNKRATTTRKDTPKWYADKQFGKSKNQFIQGQIDTANAYANKYKFSPTTEGAQESRLANIVKGSGKQVGASYMQTLAEATRDKKYNSAKASSEAGTTTSPIKKDSNRQVVDKNAEQTAKWATGKAQEGNQKLFDKSVEIQESGTKDIEKAKEGLGAVGRFGVDLASQMIQWGSDASIGALTGVGMLAPMAVRSFGSGSAEARQEGADSLHSSLYGLANAGKEVLTEKMFSPFGAMKKTAGKGIFDNLTERGAYQIANAVSSRFSKLPKNALYKAIGKATHGVLGMVEEGAEEFVGDLVEPTLKSIYDGGKARREGIDWAQAGRDFLVGGAMGGIIGGAGGIATKLSGNNEKVTYTDQEKKDAINEALKLGENSSAYHMAQSMQNQLDNGQEVLDGQIEDLTDRVVEEGLAMEKQNARAQQDATTQAMLDAQDMAGDLGSYGERTAIKTEAEAFHTMQAVAQKVSDTTAQIEQTHPDLMASGAVTDEDVQGIARIANGTATTQDIVRVNSSMQTKLLASEVLGEQLPVTNQDSIKRVQQINAQNKAVNMPEYVAEGKTRARQDVAKTFQENFGEELDEQTVAEISDAIMNTEDLSDIPNIMQSAVAYLDAGMGGFESMADPNLESIHAQHENTLSLNARSALFNSGKTIRARAEETRAKAEEETKKQAEKDSKKIRKSKKGGSLNISDSVREKAKREGKTSTINKLEALASMTGREITIVETLTTAEQKAKKLVQNGEELNGRIVIALDAQNPMMEVFKHELTHSMQTTAPTEYEEFKKYVFDTFYKSNARAYEKAIQDKIAQYAKGGYKLSEAEAEDELLADATDIFFTDADAINQLAKEHRTLAQKIHDIIASLLDLLRGEKKARYEGQWLKDIGALEEAERLWLKALDASKGMEVLEDSKLVDVIESGTVVSKASVSTLTERSELESQLIDAGFDERMAKDWVSDIYSIASIILNDRDRLDYTSHDNHTALKPNNEYVFTLDFSTLCEKKRPFQGTFNAIQKLLPNTVITSDMMIEIRAKMDEKGYVVPCGACYVEPRRRHLSKFANQWLEKVGDKYGELTLADVTTTDGLENLRFNNREAYDAFVKAMNAKGSANPKVVQLRTAYNGEILKITPSAYEKIKAIGGLRIQSFSDFELPHMIDMMQAVMDMATRKFMAQAYTKVPEFARVFGGTGIKINLSLIGKGTGLDAKGNLLFDDKEGMPAKTAFELRDKYGEDVGTIIIGMNYEHILKAWADPRIDMVIPFHSSGWGKDEIEAMGMGAWEDFEDYQTEKVYGEYLDKSKKKKVGWHAPEGGDLDPMSFWDFDKSGTENAKRYLEICAEQGRRPVFYNFLVDNGDGTYSLQSDGTTDGYWKSLVDFKCYNNEGKGAPQKEVLPNFDMESAEEILNNYTGGADDLPVHQDVVDWAVERYKNFIYDEAEEERIKKERAKERKKREKEADKKKEALYEANLKKSRSIGRASVSSSESNTLYHAGDLGKAEPFSLMSDSRHSGHFGTGTYFVGDEEQINLGNYGKRPHHKIDKSKYNLFRPKTDEEGYALHRFLKDVNTYYDTTEEEALRSPDEVVDYLNDLFESIDYYTEGGIKEVELYDDELGFDVPYEYEVEPDEERANQYKQELYDFLVQELGEYRANTLFDWKEPSEISADELAYGRIEHEFTDYGFYSWQSRLERMTDFYENMAENLADAGLDITVEKAKSIISDIREELVGKTYRDKDMDTHDTASTMFMKALGYEGVDVSGTGLDNTGYGTVIYDLKGEDLELKKKIGTARFSLSERQDAQIDKLTEEVNRLKQEFKLSKGTLPKTEDLAKSLTYMMDKYMNHRDSKLHRQLMKELEQVYTEVAKQKGKDWSELDWDSVENVAYTVADKLLNNATALHDSNWDEYQNLKKTLKGVTLKVVPAEYRAFGTYGHIKELAKGNVKISSNGTEIKTVYKQLEEQFPDWFDSEYHEEELDQFYDIISVLNEMEGQLVYHENASEAELENEIASEVVGLLFSTEPRETFADKQKTLRDNAVARERQKADDRVWKQKARDKVDKEYALNQQKKKLDAQAEDKLNKQKQQYEDKLWKQKARDKVDKEYALNKQKEKQEEAVWKQKARDKVQKEYELEQQKSKYEERIEKIRKQREDAIWKEKARRKVQREVAQNRKQERLDRQRLLKVMRRLNKMKTSNANRALIDDLIGDLDLQSMGMTKKGRINLLIQLAQYEELKASDPYFVTNKALEEKLKRLDGKFINELTIDEVRDLTEALLELEHNIKTSKKLQSIDDRRETAELVKDVVSDAREMDSRPDNAVFEAGERYMQWQLSGMRFFRKISNYNENNPLYKVGVALNEGQRKMLRFQMEASKMFDGWTGDKKFIKPFSGSKAEKLTFKLDSGETIAITPSMRASIYMHSKNEQNMKHIVGGGGLTIPDFDYYKKGNFGKALDKGNNYKFSRRDIDRIIATIPESEMKFIRQAQKFFYEKSTEALNETCNLLYGYDKATVENYFPITTDADFLSVATGMSLDQTIEGMGSMKERVNASNPIMLEDIVNVLNRSIESTGRFYGLAVPVRDYNKLINGVTWSVRDSKKVDSNAYQNGWDGTYEDLPDDITLEWEDSVRKALRQTWGSHAQKYLDNLLTDLQGGRKSDNLWIDKIRGNFAGGVLGMNLSVMLKQFASVPTASAVLGGTATLKGALTPHKANRTLIDKYTPLLWYRSKGYTDRELGDVASRGSLASKLPRLLGWIQRMDMFAVGRLWYASEAYVKKNYKDLKVGTDEYYQEVARWFDKTVEETQPNYTTMQRPDVLRTQNQIIKAMTMFSTQRMQNFNIVYEAVGNFKAKTKKFVKVKNDTNKKQLLQATKQLWRATSSQMVASGMLVAITYGSKYVMNNFGDDDKEKEAWWKTLFETLWGNILFGGEMYEAYRAIAHGDKFYGFTDQSVELLNDLSKQSIAMTQSLGEVFNWVKMKDGEEDEDGLTKEAKTPIVTKDMRSSMIDFAYTASELYGIPLENAKKLVWNAGVQRYMEANHGKYVYQYMEHSFEEAWQKDNYAKGKYGTIYKNALKAGETEQANEIAKMMREDGISQDTINNWKKNAEKEIAKSK